MTEPGYAFAGAEHELERRRLALLEDLRDPDVFDFGENPDEFRASGWR